MTFEALNAKIEALPAWYCVPPLWPTLDRELARHLRDTRLGILGLVQGQEPTEKQVGIVWKELFPEELI